MNAEPNTPEPEPSLAHAEPRIRTSDILLAVGQGEEERITVGDIIDALGDRGFGLALMLMALPVCIPGPPGLSSILGLPLIFFAIQMIRGQSRPWLPNRIRERGFGRAGFRRILERAVPWVKRVEYLCKPRLLFLVDGPAERIIGLVVLFLALVVAIPAPLTNGPPAFAVLIFGLALAEDDGIVLLVAVVVAIVCVAIAFAGLAAFATLAWTALQEINL